ncbi:MAG: gliding motility protein GldN [Marinilabiliaceae bacterium]|nr:gliding motility protein GldN [Marinilabiliaceae bacterium]
MKKVFFIMAMGLMMVSLSGQAQGVQERDTTESQRLNSLFEKNHVKNNRPIPFPYIREADVLWAKKIWRIVDLRERINLPLYYPIQRMDDRFSLINLIMHGVESKGLTAFSTKTNDEFQTIMSFDQLKYEMGAVRDTHEVQNVVTGLFERKVIEGEMKPDEIKQLLVKEIWFFDRNYSRLDVRILGICPIREFVESDGTNDQVKKKQVCWIYFNEARDLFASHEVFNPKNDAQRRTFDDIFAKRYFNSYIVKEANVYNNRQIDQYAQGLDAMLESQRIKNEIATFEHDLWEF